MRLASRIGASFGIVVKRTELGMWHAPDQAHPTAAVGTLRLVVSAVDMRLFCLQHSMLPTTIKAGARSRLSATGAFRANADDASNVWYRAYRV
jgi:hypothetical protein